ncbi:protein trichome birefringence-like 5 [Selaginella moellendorffii]|nr:protein trichome birefringence-like 5 [Selaginella moellendorffii]|eukprot:XP_002975529.2 protein trichome birefringence-like 5 [Selaginella moellendorffii]
MKVGHWHRSVALLLGIIATALLFVAISHDLRSYSIEVSTSTWISAADSRNAGSIASEVVDYEAREDEFTDPEPLDQQEQEEQGEKEEDKPEAREIEGGDSNGAAGVGFSPGNSTNRECNLYEGRWVRDESYPLFQPFTCPFVDTAFRCQENGRKDKGYLQWRWQPFGCDIPRFNALDMLKRLRNKKLAFVGDSLGRNQWESLVCMLYQGVSNRSNVFEARRQQVGKARPSYSVKFPDYKTQIDYYRTHFLVPEGRRPPGITERRRIKCSLQLDKVDKTGSKWKNADILVFNSGHWWNHGKISKRCFFIERSNYTLNMDVHAAYERAIQTWASWVDNHRGKKVFFRGFAPNHFSGGDWNTGGTCETHIQPLDDESKLDKYPDKVEAVENVLNAMKTPVTFLNVTKLSLFRKDGHVAGWGKRNGSGRQDCSHWCLPGVPDTWNELLYASLTRS